MARGINNENEKRSTSNTKLSNGKKDALQPNPSKGTTPRVQMLLPSPRIQAEFIDLLVEELKQKNLPKNLTFPVVLKTLSQSIRAIPFEYQSLRMALKERIRNHAVRVYQQLKDYTSISKEHNKNNKLKKEKHANPFLEKGKDTHLNVLSLLTSNTGQNLPLFLKESVIQPEIPTDSIVNSVQRLSLSLMVSCENMQGQIDSLIKLVEIFNSRIKTTNVTPQHFTLIHHSLKNYISLCYNLLAQNKGSEDRETCEDLLVDLLNLFTQITTTFPQSSLTFNSNSNSNSSSSSSSSFISNSSEVDLIFILSTLLLETTPQTANNMDISHENRKSSKSDHKNHTSYSLTPRTHSPTQVAKLLEILYTLPLESSAITKNGRNALAPKIITSLLSLTKIHPPTKPDTFMKFVITLLKAREMFRNLGDKSMLDETSARILGLDVPREITAITNKDPYFIEYSVEDAQRLYDNISGKDRELQTIGFLIDKQKMDNE